METLLHLTAPIFVLIGLGWIAVHLNIVPLSSVPALNAFVFMFAAPALLIRLLSQQSIDVLWQPQLFMAWLSAGLALFVGAAILTRLVFRDHLGGLAVAGQAASVGNLGFLGLPLVLQAFGPSAAGPIAVALVVDVAVLIPLSILILESQREGGDFLSTCVSAIRGAVFNPFLLSIVAGLLLVFFNIELPKPVDRTFEFLGAAAGPTALFALGMSLADKSVEGDRGPIASLVLLKLFVHPVVFGLLVVFFVVPLQQAAIALVLAALPVAGNVFVIAERYATRTRRISAAIFVSTVIAVATVTVAIEYANTLTG